MVEATIEDLADTRIYSILLGVLLVAQAVHRIRRSGFGRLEAHCQ